MKCMKVLVHQQPYKEILRSFGLEKLFSLRWSSSSWFLFNLICLWIAILEVVLPTHTWNMIISSKPCFVIIKIKINQILVSQLLYKSYIYMASIEKSDFIDDISLIYRILGNLETKFNTYYQRGGILAKSTKYRFWNDKSTKKSSVKRHVE